MAKKGEVEKHRKPTPLLHDEKQKKRYRKTGVKKTVIRKHTYTKKKNNPL